MRIHANSGSRQDLAASAQRGGTRNEGPRMDDCQGQQASLVKHSMQRQTVSSFVPANCQHIACSFTVAMAHPFLEAKHTGVNWNRREWVHDLWIIIEQRDQGVGFCEGVDQDLRMPRC